MSEHTAVVHRGMIVCGCAPGNSSVSHDFYWLDFQSYRWRRLPLSWFAPNMLDGQYGFGIYRDVLIAYQRQVVENVDYHALSGLRYPGDGGRRGFASVAGTGWAVPGRVRR